MGAASVEEAEVGACVGEGEEEGCCVEAVAFIIIGDIGMIWGLGLGVGSTGWCEGGGWRKIWEGSYAQGAFC